MTRNHRLTSEYFVICGGCGKVRSFPGVANITRYHEKKRKKDYTGLCQACFLKTLDVHHYFVPCPKCREMREYNSIIPIINMKSDRVCNTCRSLLKIQRIELVNIMKENGCAVCGYDKSFAALEFHHVIRNEKSFRLSRYVKVSILQLIDELNKCVLLCSNCHREIHSKR